MVLTLRVGSNKHKKYNINILMKPEKWTNNMKLLER